MQDLETLDNFLSRVTKPTRSHPYNAYVSHPGFEELYVRYGIRYVFNQKINVLDIARVISNNPGSGVFTSLVRNLHAQGFNLYIESVLCGRFMNKLIKLGFTRISSNNFYLCSRDKLNG